VIDDHVAQGADGVVEVAAVLDAEALGHRDLDALDVVAIPHRLEHRVGEAQVQQLLEAHLPEEVVDPVELVLGDVLMQLVGQRPGRGLVVAERLLDHHPRRRGQPGVGEAGHDLAEQERRDLQVEDRHVRAFDGVRHPAVRGGVAEVALHVGEPGGQPVEDGVVERLPGAGDGRAGPVDELGLGPVVDRHADDRAVEQPPALQPVERAEGHDLGQVAGDPEDHQHVRRPGLPIVGVRHTGLLSLVRAGRCAR
jgi:hypothetical protein